MFSFDPYSSAVDADPFAHYKILRDEHPCFWSSDANMWILSRYADIFAALNDWQTYSSAKGNLMDELPGRAGATLGTTDPPRHNRLRALISHAFTKRSLESISDEIREVTLEQLATLQGKKQFDFVADFSSKVTTKILFRILGLPPGDDAMVRDKAVLMVQSDPKTRQKGAGHVAAYNWMQEYAAKVIAERTKNPCEDLISQLVLAEIDGEKLLEREILLTSTTLIMAGIESLGGFMTMFAYNMANFDGARRACAANNALIPDAMEESLRYNTSAQRFRRCLTRDIEVHGQQLKVGDFVCMAYGSANRDERKFENADIYDITRKPRAHLGFGGGVHSCLGSMVARIAINIIFSELLKQFPEFKCADENLTWMSSTTFRSPMVLKLNVH